MVYIFALSHGNGTQADLYLSSIKTKRVEARWICLPMQDTWVWSLIWGKILHASEQLSLCPTTMEPVLQSLGATTTKAPVSPGKTKHAYSRYLNVRFGDNIVQVWPTCLHFSERKTHREDLSQVPQWEGLTEGPKVASSASLGLWWGISGCGWQMLRLPWVL